MKEKIHSVDRAAAPGPGLLSKTHSKKVMISNNNSVKGSSTSIVSKTEGKPQNKQQVSI